MMVEGEEAAVEEDGAGRRESKLQKRVKRKINFHTGTDADISKSEVTERERMNWHVLPSNVADVANDELDARVLQPLGE